MGDCDHGSDPQSCPVCLGPVKRDPVSVVARFVAGFDGRCRVCGSDIWAGHRVARLSDDRVVHDLCAAEVGR